MKIRNLFTPAKGISLASAALAGAMILAPAFASAGSTKDIVLDSVAPSAQAARAQTTNDAMAISVLLEKADGTLTPRSTQVLFHTGDRFRIKVVASRVGKLSFFNTNPLGVTGRDPVWSGTVVPGQETISPRLRLDGNSGEDQLHVVFEPVDVGQGTWGWLNQILNSKGASKDIRLDVENTQSTSYVLNQAGQGLVSTVRIVHSR